MDGTIIMMVKMTSTRLAVLMAATIIGIVGISAATTLVAEAQIAIRENGVGLVDQSNVEQTTEQELNQEACTNTAAPFVPGGSVLSSGAQSNDCEADQTQTASSVSRTRHDMAMNSIRNLPG
jgi:hypothetical protein